MIESAEQRSRTMRAVKGRDTTPELAVRSLLHRAGYRFRLHRRDLPGNPDIVFPGRRKVIFIHGCFWHGHDCNRGARQPKTNVDYWRRKIARNRARDHMNQLSLTKSGWSALTVWECEIAQCESIMKKLRRFLESRSAIGQAAPRTKLLPQRHVHEARSAR
jgi:DNA mismatch endonuclease (patch repair protein)